MMIDKVIKWHETKDIALANEICEDLYELEKQLDQYEKLESEADEIAEEDRVYRKKIVR